MDEEVPSDNEIGQKKVSLHTDVANGIKYAIATLDENESGKVAKSHLQAVVANICQAFGISYVSDDLDGYLPEQTELSVSEFLEFLESKLLVKGKKLDPKKLDKLSWVLVGQNYEDSPHILSKNDAFKLWCIFKKLDVGCDLRVDIEELCIIMEKFVRGLGLQWSEASLHKYEVDGALTFWKFIKCMEELLEGVEKSVLNEGLRELYDLILDEVMRTGFLTKKGHSVIKSQKSRWFVLKSGTLSYYVSSGYYLKKGEIILNKNAKVTSIPDKGSNKYRFSVVCGSTNKEFEQIAPDQRTKQAWINDIQIAIDCFGGNSPLIRDLLSRKAKRDEMRAKKDEEERKRREQENLLNEQRKEIDLLKRRKDEIEKSAEEEKALLDAEIKRREELEELQRNLQQLLEDQKKAREEDEKIRAAKERLLEEERAKREQLEALRQQQQEELQSEKIQKEELIVRQKEQERVLEEERKRLQHLEEEREKAEEAAKAAKDKLTAAETAAKNAAEKAKDKVRQLKTSIGLKGTVGPKVDPLVTHRGKGAFTLEEFLSRATEWSGLTLDEERAKSSAPEVDELVKASSTPASNQNIPEFLKKAAAWSGLNPDTYLESGKLENTEKKSSPPKVAAKPPKPVPSLENSTEPDHGGEKVQFGMNAGDGVKEIPQRDDLLAHDSGERYIDEPLKSDQDTCNGGEDKEEPQNDVEETCNDGEVKVEDGEVPKIDVKDMSDGGEVEVEDKEGQQNDVKDMSDGGEVKVEVEDKEEPQNDVKDMCDGAEIKVEDKEEQKNDVKDMCDGADIKVEDKEEPQNDVEDMCDGGDVKVEDKEEPQNDVKDMCDGSEVKVEDKEEPQNDVKDMCDGSDVKVEDKEEPQNDVKDMCDGGEVKVEDKEGPQNDVKDMCDGGEVKVEDKEGPQNDVKDMCDGGEVKVEDKEEPQNDVKDMSDGGEVSNKDTQESSDDVKLEALVSESDISEVEIIQPNGPKELCGNNDEELQGKTTVKSDEKDVDNCKILADVDKDDCSNHMVNDSTAVYLKSGGDEENMNVFDVGFKEGEKEESFEGDFVSSVETKQFVSKNEPTGIPHTDEFEKKKVEIDKVDPDVESVKKCDPTTETECLEKSQFSENFSSSDVVNENGAEGTTQDTVKNGLSSDEIAMKMENDNTKEINELSMITSKTNECLKRGEDEIIEK